MDSVNVVRLLRTQYAESAARLLAPFDEQRVLQYVVTTIAKCPVVIVEQNGRLLGSAAIAPVILPWCGKIVMGEAWFAVVAGYRDKGTPQELLKWLGAFLDREGLAAVFGTNLLAPANFDAVLRKQGGMEQGRTSYLRVPATAKKEVA